MNRIFIKQNKAKNSLRQSLRKVFSRPSSQLGMSLIEIMVVLVIIAMVAGGIGVKVMDSFRKSKIDTTKIFMSKIISAYPLWQETKGADACLTSENIETLREVAAYNPPYGNDPITDAWKRPFKIICPTPAGIDLISFGPDGKEGTEDDITSFKK